MGPFRCATQEWRQTISTKREVSAHAGAVDAIGLACDRIKQVSRVLR
jgi:hypothetical protein